MEKLKILIKAPKEKVWKTLWDDNTYRQWTTVFSRGAYAKSDWKEGSRIEFLNPDNNGIFSFIFTKIENTQMTFKHLGQIKQGKDVPTNWKDSRESYFLTDRNGQTELKVELDSVAEFSQYFTDAFPKALQVVKEIAEK